MNIPPTDRYLAAVAALEAHRGLSLPKPGTRHLARHRANPDGDEALELAYDDDANERLGL